MCVISGYPPILPNNMYIANKLDNALVILYPINLQAESWEISHCGFKFYHFKPQRRNPVSSQHPKLTRSL